MPLSEEELRLLEQMERALVEEDPKFASTLRGTTLRQAARRRALLAGFVFAIGIAVLMGGAISGLWQIGIVGFVIMLGSATIGLSAVRGQGMERPAEARRRPGPDGTSLRLRRHRRWPFAQPPPPQGQDLRLLHGAGRGAVAPPQGRPRLLS